MVQEPFNDQCEINCIHEDVVQRMKNRALPEAAVIQLAEIFKVLGDPTRVKIIYALSHEEMCVCDIAALLEMQQSAVSHQLRILRNMRLVKFRKKGKIVYYSLDDSHIVGLFQQGLDHVRHV